MSIYFSEPKFGISNRGYPCITISGHKFAKHVVKGAKTRWRCCHAVRGCPAVIYTLTGEDTIVKYNSNHNHS